MSRFDTLKNIAFVISAAFAAASFQNCAPVYAPEKAAKNEDGDGDGKSSVPDDFGGIDDAGDGAVNPQNSSDQWEHENNTIEGQIRSYYLTYLGREPDAAGFNHFVTRAQNGTSLDFIRNEISQSNEAKIREFYQTHLRREPDVPGMEYWLGRAAGGMKLEEIRYHFRISDECIMLCLPKPTPAPAR